MSSADAEDVEGAEGADDVGRGSGWAARTRSLVRAGARFIRNRGRAGGVRARYSVIPALQMTVAGVGGYLVAEQVLGHDAPLFAAIAALIALGFTREPRLQKVVEVAIGCTLGIFIGDMLLHLLGPGVPTASLVLFVSIMLARLLDSSPLLAMQMGLQGLLVVLIPPPEAEMFGPFTRSVDAIVGGAVAMVIALLTPNDPRHEPIRELKLVLDELTKGLRETATAVRTSEAREAWHALIRCRGLQPQIDDVGDAVRSARELTRFSPAYRRHRHYVRRMDRVLDKADLTIRSMRVVSRRTVSMLDNGAISDEGTKQLSTVFEELADASLIISRAVANPGPEYAPRMEAAQERLVAVAIQLHPARLAIDTLEGETVVLLLRTMVVDMMEAAGMDHDDAVDYLPKL